MVEEADNLMLYKIGLGTEVIPIAGEAAYCNEDLGKAMRETLLWKDKGRDVADD